MTFEQFAATVRDWASRLAPAQVRLAAESIMVTVDDLPLGTTFYRALAKGAKSAPAAARDEEGKSNGVAPQPVGSIAAADRDARSL